MCRGGAKLSQAAYIYMAVQGCLSRRRWIFAMYVCVYVQHILGLLVDPPLLCGVRSGIREILAKGILGKYHRIVRPSHVMQ